MHRQVVGLSHQDAIGVECAASCNKRPTLVATGVRDGQQDHRLKAYFRLRGEEGAQSGYEKLLIEQRANAQRKAIEKIRREYSETEVVTDLNLTVVNLRKGAAFIFNARLDDDRHAVVFDALRKTDGPSTLGDVRYQPVMFCAARQVRARRQAASSTCG
jgi:hypothetical protein